MLDVLLVLGAETPSGRAVARKLRSEHYCCRLMTSGADAGQVAGQAPAGILLAGEAAEGALPPDPKILSLGIPVMALGSAARALLSQIGARGENEAARDEVVSVAYHGSPLFQDVVAGERWIGCAEPFALPEPYRVIAEGAGLPLAFASGDDRQFFLQFQIERNDPDGMAMLLSFAKAVCKCTPWWTADNILSESEKAIRAAVRDGEALCALSGGLDSTVAALLAKRALGERARCVFVDTGLLRLGEVEEIEARFASDLQLNCVRVDVSGRVLDALKGLTEPEAKWRVIEREINRALLDEANKRPGATVFDKGTNFIDIIGAKDAPQGPPSDKVVEPLGELFKDEIRMLGQVMQLSPAMLGRQPFPGMGLAARIQGAVDAERLRVLRAADAIFAETLIEAGQEKKLSRYFAMLVQVGGQDMILLRSTHGFEPTMAVARLPYDVLERTVERILKELPTVARVFYDVTPGKAEWLK